MSAGDQHTAYVLQVYGYWDMVAALVFHGALDESLVYSACPEMYFQFAKIRPYIEDFRSKSSLPELFNNVQKFVEGSEEGRARLDSMAGHIRLSAESIKSLRGNQQNPDLSGSRGAPQIPRLRSG